MRFVKDGAVKITDNPIKAAYLLKMGFTEESPAVFEQLAEKRPTGEESQATTETTVTEENNTAEVNEKPERKEGRRDGTAGRDKASAGDNKQ